jgi:hypothetical protein
VEVTPGPNQAPVLIDASTLVPGSSLPAVQDVVNQNLSDILQLQAVLKAIPLMPASCPTFTTSTDDFAPSPCTVAVYLQTQGVPLAEVIAAVVPGPSQDFTIYYIPPGPSR